jgi:hypothetical protein
VHAIFAGAQPSIKAALLDQGLRADRFGGTRMEWASTRRQNKDEMIDKGITKIAMETAPM